MFVVIFDLIVCKCASLYYLFVLIFINEISCVDLTFFATMFVQTTTALPQIDEATCPPQ